VRLEIGVSEPFVKPTVEAILKAARTGEVGDGKVFVIPVEKPRVYPLPPSLREIKHEAGCGHNPSR
jgi:hypothetical protein